MGNYSKYWSDEEVEQALKNFPELFDDKHGDFDDTCFIRLAAKEFELADTKNNRAATLRKQVQMMADTFGMSLNVGMANLNFQEQLRHLSNIEELCKYMLYAVSKEMELLVGEFEEQRPPGKENSRQTG